MKILFPELLVAFFEEELSSRHPTSTNSGARFGGLLSMKLAFQASCDGPGEEYSYVRSAVLWWEPFGVLATIVPIGSIVRYWGPPMRLGADAEITHITLRSGQLGTEPHAVAS